MSDLLAWDKRPDSSDVTGDWARRPFKIKTPILSMASDKSSWADLPGTVITHKL
ncbi:hypothetical protein BaRGS_00023953 [Batillaria attramentaria]|uniref:Uncharacterized protein n=1 Tax=Batillaria attramentaria TaxID=370345 RepID=A0ABD0KCA6_9CAEN